MIHRHERKATTSPFLTLRSGKLAKFRNLTLNNMRGFLVFLAHETARGFHVPAGIVQRRTVLAEKRDLSEQFGDFVDLATPYFRETSEAKWGLGKVVGLTLLQSGVSVAFSYLSRDFYTALSNREIEAFQTILLKFAGALSLGVPVTVLYRYEREQLALRWRAWMTQDVLRRYCDSRKYYELEILTEQNGTLIDNPDQRITDDVGAFTDISLAFGITALTSVIDLVSFSTILYSIYAPLFFAIFAYAFIGTALTAYVGRDLATQNFAALAREADFRYSLVRLRENAEAVAFYNGEQRERTVAATRFDDAVDAQSQIIQTQRSVEFVTVAYRFLVQILPIAVVAPLYFQQKIELGVVTQSSSAFNHVLGDLSAIINQFEAIAAFGAGLDRLASFTGRLDDTSSTDEFPQVRQPDSSSPIVLKTSHFAVGTPDGERILVRDLDLELRKGDRLLLVGASGAGKSSTLRALAGLWRPQNGTVSFLVDKDDVFFLPQRPYCTLGTLKDQLLYPANETTAETALVSVLHDVGLEALVPRLDDTLDWARTLSLGEQQRLAFARLFLAKPKLAVCDEATSALSIEAERHLYNLLDTKLGSDLALISVGHRPSLLEHHNLRLRLPIADDGGFGILEPISDDDKAAVARIGNL